MLSFLYRRYLEGSYLNYKKVCILRCTIRKVFLSRKYGRKKTRIRSLQPEVASAEESALRDPRQPAS